MTGLAGDKTSLCSILTWSSRSGAEVNDFTHKGHEKFSTVVPVPNDGDVKSKCFLIMLNTFLLILQKSLNYNVPVDVLLEIIRIIASITAHWTLKGWGCGF